MTDPTPARRVAAVAASLVLRGTSWASSAASLGDPYHAHHAQKEEERS